MNPLSNLKNDLPASIVVFFVAVPLCLGIALASGVNLFAGLIAGIVGGIIVGAISGSPLGVSGPAAGLVVIVLGAIESLGSFPGFLLALVLAGILQIALGVLRAGGIAYFFPASVIKGMLSGIGLIIIIKQIPLSFGYEAKWKGDLDKSAMMVAFVSLAILILWEAVLAKRFKIFKLIQGPLVAVAFGIAFQAITSSSFPDYALASSHLVSVPVSASFDEFLGNFQMPDWSFFSNAQVYVVAVTIAVVASLETLLCVEATDKLDPKKRVTPTNRELIAQGAGNLISGLIGGLPVTQVIVRSSANIQSGANSKMSAIMHGCFLLLSVVFLPELLNMVPLAVLAAILLVVGYKLAKPSLFKDMFSKGKGQWIPFMLTVGGLVFTDLLTGIGIGLVCAIGFILHRNYTNSHFLHMKESDNEAEHRHEVNIRFADEVTFLNKAAVRRALSSIPDSSLVVIDATQCYYFDLDVLDQIEDFKESASSRHIVVDFRPPEANNPETMQSGVATTPSA